MAVYAVQCCWAVHDSPTVSGLCIHYDSSHNQSLLALCTTPTYISPCTLLHIAASPLVLPRVQSQRNRLELCVACTTILYHLLAIMLMHVWQARMNTTRQQLRRQERFCRRGSALAPSQIQSLSARTGLPNREDRLALRTAGWGMWTVDNIIGTKWH